MINLANFLAASIHFLSLLHRPGAPAEPGGTFGKAGRLFWLSKDLTSMAAAELPLGRTSIVCHQLMVRAAKEKVLSWVSPCFVQSNRKMARLTSVAIKFFLRCLIFINRKIAFHVFNRHSSAKITTSVPSPSFPLPFSLIFAEVLLTHSITTG